MRNRKTVFVAVAAGAALVALVFAFGASAGPVPEPRPDSSDAAIDAVRAGKGRLIDTSVRYSGWWQRCRFVIHQSPVKSYETGFGAVSVEEKPEPVADTPPPPGCTDREPTELEITAMKTEVDARNAGSRPAGAPPLPDLGTGGANGTPGPRTGAPPTAQA